jgi:hypothetical protein
LVALGAVVALLAVGLLIWSPWSGPDLVSRDMVVVPYSVSVPSDWQTTTETTDATFTVFGAKDWSALVKGESDAISSAQTAAKQDPQSLVYLYVDASDNVYAETPVDAASQLQSALGGRLVEQGTRDVGGKKGLEVGGVIPLGESGAQLRLYAVAVKDDPRMLMIFLCPPSIYEQWRPTFDAMVDSVKYTG